MKKKEQKNGFTIVEVSLVLAIAGLIFLMIFVALPALQKSQRDARRRDDVGKLLTALQKYQTNNRGALPSGNGVAPSSDLKDWTSFYESFLGSDFKDPSGQAYKLKIVDCGGNIAKKVCSNGNEVNDASASFENSDYTMHIVRSATCNASKAVVSSNPRKVAVLYKMEGAGAYCANM